MVVAVLPERGAALHRPLDPWCWCAPIWDFEADGVLLVHNLPNEAIVHTRWLAVPYPEARLVVAVA